VCIFLLSNKCHVPRPSHRPSFGPLLISGEKCKQCRSLLHSFLRPPVFFDYVQIFTSPSCSQKPQSVSPLIKDTLFHTYTRSVRNDQCVCFNP
jgi:hypothetical protein